MKKVLLVAPLPPPYGGIAHWTTMVKRHSQSAGRIPLQVVDTALRHRSIFDKSFVKRVLRAIPYFLRQMREVCRLLPDENVLALHLTTSGQYSLARDVAILFFAKLFRRRSVLHIRSGRLPALLETSSIKATMLRLALRMASHVIAIDQTTTAAIRQNLPSVRLSTIPNCIDLTVLPEIPAEKDRVVLFVGWVLPEKGIEELIRAWAHIGHYDWHLKIIGPCASEYAKYLARTYDLHGIEIVGEYENSRALLEMARAEILCLPSYTEGFPNVILEAMALRCAVIATPVGAIPELLANGAGAIVKERDDMALAAQLLAIMEDQNARQQMVASASDRVHNEYAIDRVYRSYEEIWKSDVV